MSKIDVKHANVVLKLEKEFYQGMCACGWTSSIDFYEAADLLRAMHAHAVATFRSYQ